MLIIKTLILKNRVYLIFKYIMMNKKDVKIQEFLPVLDPVILRKTISENFIITLTKNL